MAKIARVDEDASTEHDDKSLAERKFATGSTNVFLNGKGIVRVTDTTHCGDVAIAGSGSVFVNGKKVHRQGDALLSHEDEPITCASGSPDGFAG